MFMKNKIIEYLDNGKFIVATVVEDTGNRLKLINQNGREVNLPLSRIVHATSKPNPAGQSREDLLKKLKKTSESRTSLMRIVNLHEIWEISSEEPENSYDPSFLAGLCFGEDATDDQVASLLRCVFVDPLYFKYKQGKVISHSPEIVEQIRLRLEKEKHREALLEAGAKGLILLSKGDDIRDWPEKDRCLQLVKNYYLFGSEAEDYDTARDLLKRANLTAPHDVFHLLVKCGIWKKNENIPLLRSGIPLDFSDEAIDQIKTIIDPDADQLINHGRKDLRDLSLITIDGADTRDYDDALHIEKHGDNYMVGVHISDVALYVKPGDPLFDEALSRGTSIYFPEGPLPMLPKELSEGVCSLVANKTRAVLSCMFLFSPEGEVLQFETFPSVVKVKRQLSYQDADKLIGTDWEISTLSKLSVKLRDQRLSSGALLLPFPDVNIQIGPDESTNVYLSEVDTPGRVLISEFMILANTYCAGYLADREAPGLYRSQKPPRQRLVHGLDKDLFINARQRKKLSPMSLSIKPGPHAGVGVQYYTTVTSPIRRFLDLVLQHQLYSIMAGRGILFSPAELERFAVNIESTRNRANQVRYLRHRYWLLKHLESKKGQRFTSIIVEKGPKRAHLLLSDFLLDVDMPANQAINAKPGDSVSIRLEKVNALNNFIRFEW